MEPARGGGRSDGVVSSDDLPERHAPDETGIVPRSHLDSPRLGSGKRGTAGSSELREACNL
eukprot:14097525-Alexandrium_andersonii.AAC.1